MFGTAFCAWHLGDLFSGGLLWEFYCVTHKTEIGYPLSLKIICVFYQPIGVYVENLSEFVVRSPSEVLSLLSVGKKRLVFAETKMNRNSSRYNNT